MSETLHGDERPDPARIPLPEAYLQRLLSGNERGNILDPAVGNTAALSWNENVRARVRKIPSGPSDRDVTLESEVPRDRVRNRICCFLQEKIKMQRKRQLYGMEVPKSAEEPQDNANSSNIFATFRQIINVTLLITQRRCSRHGFLVILYVTFTK